MGFLLSLVGGNTSATKLVGDASLAPSANFTRASSAWAVNDAGFITEVPANQPRYEYRNFSVSNLVQNPNNVGAVAGVLDAGGSLPTRWGAWRDTALTTRVVGTGVEDGIPYMDVRISGTPDPQQGQGVYFYPEPDRPNLAVGESVTGSAYIRVLSGARPSTLYMGVDAYNSGGYITTASQSYPTMTPANLAAGRMTATYTATAAGQSAGLSITVNHPTAMDVTLRIGGVQLEKAASAGVLTLPPAGLVGVSGGPVVNYMRNPRGAGAVLGTVGSGGSLPTFWFPGGSASPVTRTIVGMGEEDGIPYVDVQIAGTPTSGATCDIYFDNGSGQPLPRVVGEVATFSMYVRKIAGNWPSDASVRMFELDALNAYKRDGGTNILQPNVASLKDARYSCTMTVLNAATTSVYGGFRFSPVQNQPFNVTLRIGGVQMEKGNMLNPLMMPPAGQVRASGNGTPVGMVIEGSRTNVLSYSYVASGIGWNFTTATTAAVASNVIAPNGGVSGVWSQGLQANGSVPYMQCFNETANSFFNGNTNYVDLNSDTWTRQTMTFIVPDGCTNMRIYPMRENAANYVFRGGIPVTAGQVWTFSTYAKYTADESVVLLWGAQLELGTFATSHIPTAGTSVTRASDALLFSIGARPTGGFAMKFNQLGLRTGADNMGLFEIDRDGLTSGRYIAWIVQSGNVIPVTTAVDTGSVVNLTTLGNYTPGTWSAIAVRWTPAGVTMQLNNGTPQGNAVASATLNTIRVGSSSPTLADGRMGFGTFANATYWQDPPSLTAMIKEVSK